MKASKYHMIKQHPQVSIIITSYNKFNFIIDAIKSATNQSYPNIEIIIVDDASNDGSSNLIASYIKNNSNIRLFQNAINKGVVYSRNYGILHSNGKYILPLDGDDYIAESYVSEAVSYMESHGDCGICYCIAAKVDNKQNFKIWNLPKFTLGQEAISNVIFSTALFKRSDWEKVGGYDEEFNFGYEDWAFWIKILELDRSVYRIPKVLFFYRQSCNERSDLATPNFKLALEYIYKKNNWLLRNQEVIETIVNTIVNYPQLDNKLKKSKRKFKILILLLLSSFIMLIFVQDLLLS